MLWNGVSRMPRFSAHRCMNESSSSSTAAAAASAPFARRRAEPVLGPATELLHVPRQAEVGDRPWRTPSAHALASGIGAAKSSVAQAGRQRGPDRGERERVAGERAADSADVDRRAPSTGRAAARRSPRSCRTRPRACRHRWSCRRRRSRDRGPTPPWRRPGPTQIVCVSSITSSTPCRRVISRTASR